MAPRPESPNGNAKKPAPRRKAKPKFEVPKEVAGAAPAAWVYRESGPTKAAAASLPRPRQAHPVNSDDPRSLMLVALETMAHSVAAGTRLMLAAASLMGAPIEVTRKILGM